MEAERDSAVRKTESRRRPLHPKVVFPAAAVSFWQRRRPNGSIPLNCFVGGRPPLATARKGKVVASPLIVAFFPFRKKGNGVMHISPEADASTSLSQLTLFYDAFILFRLALGTLDKGSFLQCCLLPRPLPFPPLSPGSLSLTPLLLPCSLRAPANLTLKPLGGVTEIRQFRD